MLQKDLSVVLFEWPMRTGAKFFGFFFPKRGTPLALASLGDRMDGGISKWCSPSSMCCRQVVQREKRGEAAPRLNLLHAKISATRAMTARRNAR